MAGFDIGSGASLAVSGARIAASGGTDITAWASAAATVLSSIFGGGGGGGPATGTGYRVSGTVTNEGFKGSWFGRSANSKQAFEFPLEPAEGQTRALNAEYGGLFAQIPAGVSIPVNATLPQVDDKEFRRILADGIGQAINTAKSQFMNAPTIGGQGGGGGGAQVGSAESTSAPDYRNLLLAAAVIAVLYYFTKK